jgi:hypothetical protein
MSLRKILNNIFDLDRKVYDPAVVSRPSKEQVIFNIQVQLRELRLATNNIQLAKEYADVLLIALHALRGLNLDPEAAVMRRLNEHVEKTVQQIIDKYAIAYHISQGDICQLCAKVLQTPTEIKFLVCSKCYKRSMTGEVPDGY